MRPHVAIATSQVLPEPDADEAPLLGALARGGAAVSLLAWDAPDPMPDPAVDLVVLRSTWTYPQAAHAFLGWLARLEGRVRVLNPPGVVRANVDKAYLRDLEARGVPIVPTALCDRGDPRSLEEVCAAQGLALGEIVVKPRVSAGSFRTARFASPTDPAAAAFFRGLVAERDAMVQPYLPSVEGRGEISIVALDGAPSHAVRKSPRFSGDDESVRPVPLEAEERAFAEAVLAPLGPLLYARVDTARDERGALVLMELELIEPSLFLGAREGALEALAGAILREARRG